MVRPKKHLFDRKPYGSVIYSIIEGHDNKNAVKDDFNKLRGNKKQATWNSVNFLFQNLEREGYIKPRVGRHRRESVPYDIVWKKVLTDFLILKLKERSDEYRDEIDFGYPREDEIRSFLNKCDGRLFMFLTEYKRYEPLTEYDQYQDDGLIPEFEKDDPYNLHQEHFQVGLCRWYFENLTKEQTGNTLNFHLTRILRIYLDAYYTVAIEAALGSQGMFKYIHDLTNEMHEFASICERLLFYDVSRTAFDFSKRIHGLLDAYYYQCYNNNDYSTFNNLGGVPNYIFTKTKIKKIKK